jgi:hypothetical protein
MAGAHPSVEPDGLKGAGALKHSLGERLAAQRAGQGYALRRNTGKLLQPLVCVRDLSINRLRRLLRIG